MDNSSNPLLASQFEVRIRRRGNISSTAFLLISDPPLFVNERSARDVPHGAFHARQVSHFHFHLHAPPQKLNVKNKIPFPESSATF